MWELTQLDDAPPCFRPVQGFPGGLMYGMAVYTTFRLPLSAQWLNAHLQRLTNHAGQVGLPIAFSQEGLRQALAAFTLDESAVCRLTAVADVQEYGDFYGQSERPARLLLSTRKPPSSPSKPLALKSVDYTRSMPQIKHLGMAEVVKLKRFALQSGFQEILLAGDGRVREASTANIFFIQGNQLITPEPERDACLPGITRLRAISAAHAQGLAVSTEAPILLKNIGAMDGAFLCNAVQGLVKISRIDESPLPWPEQAESLFSSLSEAVV